MLYIDPGVLCGGVNYRSMGREGVGQKKKKTGLNEISTLPKRKATAKPSGFGTTSSIDLLRIRIRLREPPASEQQRPTKGWEQERGEPLRDGTDMPLRQPMENSECRKRRGRWIYATAGTSRNPWKLQKPSCHRSSLPQDLSGTVGAHSPVVRHLESRGTECQPRGAIPARLAKGACSPRKKTAHTPRSCVA